MLNMDSLSTQRIVVVSQPSDGQHFYHIDQAFLGNEFILYVNPDYLAKYNPIRICLTPARECPRFLDSDIPDAQALLLCAGH